MVNKFKLWFQLHNKYLFKKQKMRVNNQKLYQKFNQLQFFKKITCMDQVINKKKRKQLKLKINQEDHNWRMKTKKEIVNGWIKQSRLRKKEKLYQLNKNWKFKMLGLSQKDKDQRTLKKEIINNNFKIKENNSPNRIMKSKATVKCLISKVDKDNQSIMVREEIQQDRCKRFRSAQQLQERTFSDTPSNIK